MVRLLWSRTDPKEYLEINDVLALIAKIALKLLRQHSSRQWTKAVSKVLSWFERFAVIFGVRVSVASVLLKRSTPS